MPAPKRTADQIRAEIEVNRQQLGVSLEKLRADVIKATDWRAHLRAHQPQAMAAAAVTGFMLGGGIAALGAMTFGRRRRRKAAAAALA